jgi:hypothetical protein
MSEQEKIDQYDVVEIVHIPPEYEGVISIGDIGVVIEKYDDETFEIECVETSGSCKWLATLTIKDIRLKSKDPFSRWAQKSLTEKSITKPSIALGTLLGAALGALIGGGLGAITRSLNGILIGLVLGLVFGVLTGALTAALTVKTAGTTGGIGVGYFTGMLFGGVLGMLLGALIPTSLRMSAHTESLPLLDALMLGRFETGMLLSFPLSVLATVVGVWVSGKNYVPRNLKERYRP